MPDFDCVFCRKIDAGDIEYSWYRTDSFDELDRIVAFTPLNPVTPGHLLFVPTIHLDDFMTYPRISSQVVERAAKFAKANFLSKVTDYNLITSAGPAATQTIKHLHIHLVPRRAGDGLHLPWTGQK